VKAKRWRYEKLALGGWVVSDNRAGDAFICDSEAAALRAVVILNYISAILTTLRALQNCPEGTDIIGFTKDLAQDAERLAAALKSSHQHMDDQNARGHTAQCYWCGSKGYDADGLTHLDVCPIRQSRRALADYHAHQGKEEKG